MANPFEGSSSSKNPFGGSSYGSASPLKTSSKGVLTADQALHLAHILASKPQRSFWGDVKHAGGDVLHPIEWSFDKLMRPSYAVASGVDAGITKGSVGAGLHGAREGFMGRNKEGFGQVLQHHGVLKNHNLLRGIAGFGLDVATDPLTYAMLGTESIAGHTAADAAAVVARKEVGFDMSKQAAKEGMRTLEPHAATLRAAGDHFAHNAALAEHKLNILGKISKGTTPGMKDWAQLSKARDAAREEFKLYAPKGIKASYKLPFLPKVSTPLVKAPLPTLEKTAGANIPVLSKVAAGVGHAFVGGYTGAREDRLIHRLAINTKHQGERFASQYFEHLRTAFKGVENISEKDQIRALHFFEKEGGIVKQGGKYKLSQKRIAEARKAGLTEKQLAFVKAIHNVSEHLASLDRQFGINYTHLGEKGKLYVPHITAEDAAHLGFTQEHRSLVNARGYMKDSEHPFTIDEIQKLKEMGKLPKGVKTSPYEIFIHRVRAAANAHADASLAGYLRDAVGVRTRLVDEGALASNHKAQTALQSKIGQHTHSSPRVAAKALAAEQRFIDQAARSDAYHKMQILVDKNSASIRKHLAGSHSQTTMATVTRLSNQSARAQRIHAETTKLIDAGQHEGVNKKLAKVAEAHAAQQADFAKLQRELKRLGNKEREIVKGKKNPALKDSQYLHMEKSNSGLKANFVDEHGHPYALPEHLAGAVHRFERIASNDPKAIADFKRGYTKALSKWKLGVTSVNPGYRIRNTLSDYWNMWLAGVSSANMVKYSARAAHVMVSAKRGDKWAQNIINNAYDHGIFSGLFPGDVQTVSNMLEHGGSKTALVKQARPVKLYTKIASDINRNAENHVRLAHYLYRREAEHLSITQSAEWVRKAHFDYEDLSSFEQKTMKSIAPFYTWTRKNLPYQIERLIQAPGRMAAFSKFANEMEQASPANATGIPGYLNRGMFLKVPVGHNNFLNPTVGISDLAKIEHPLDAVKSLLTPAAKVPADLLAHRNMMTGADIGGPDAINPRNPVRDGIVADLLSLIPGSNVGPTARQNKRGAGAAPWLTYLAGQTPITNLAVNQGGKLKGRSAGPATLGYLSGISTQQVDPKLQSTIDTITEGKAFKQSMKTLRAEGYPFPKKHKGSRNQNRFTKSLNTRLSGR